MEQRKGKKPGEVAYKHYLRTGDIVGVLEGAVIRGPGTPPEHPMGMEKFLEESRKVPPPSAKQDDDPWSQDLVMRVLRDNRQLSERAIDEGWIVGLYDFVRDEHRLPRTGDITDLRRNASFVREAAAGRENLSSDLVTLARVLMERRTLLAEGVRS